MVFGFEEGLKALRKAFESLCKFKKKKSKFTSFTPFLSFDINPELYF